MHTARRFLIVENVRQSRDSLKGFATTLGASAVDCAHYSSDVKVLCNRNRYDVLFLGYDLGSKHKNGQQLLEELREEQLLSRHCIVIMITAEVSQEMVLAALEYKPDDYIVKPISFQLIKSRLQKAIAKKKQMFSIYQAMEYNNSKKVIRLCEEQISAQSPHSLECLGIMSRHYLELEQYEQAKAIYQNNVVVDDQQWSSMGLGKLALSNKDFFTAEQHFKQVITANPFYLSAYDALADSYEQSNNFVEAENTLELALLLSPRSLVRLNRYAKVCLINQKFHKAIDAFYKTFELATHSNHRSPEIAINFAETILEHYQELSTQELQKLSQKAQRILKESVRNSSKPEYSIIAKLLSARLYKQINDKYLVNSLVSDAVKQLDKYREHVSHQGLLAISAYLISLEQQHVANENLKWLAETQPMDTELLADIEAQIGFPISDDALFDAKQAYADGLDYFQEKDWHHAIDAFNTALGLFPAHIGIKLSLLEAILASAEHKVGRKADLITFDLLMMQLSSKANSHEIQLRLKQIEANKKAINNLMAY